MNKYAIIFLYFNFNLGLCLFRFKEKSLTKQSFGHPEMIDPVFLASKEEYFYNVDFSKSKIYFSRNSNDDIIFEAETDEEAKLYFEVYDE